MARRLIKARCGSKMLLWVGRRKEDQVRGAEETNLYSLLEGSPDAVQ